MFSSKTDMKKNVSGSSTTIWQYFAAIAGKDLHSISVDNFHYFKTVLAALSILIVGNAWAWPSAAKVILFEEDDPPIIVTEEAFGTIASLSLLGAVPGSFIGTLFINKIGRKPVMILTTIPFIVSWLLIYFAKSESWLFASRFLFGLGAGTALTVVPLYIGEISSPEVRGRLSSLTMVLMKGGTLMAYVLGPLVSFYTNGLIIAICSIILFIILLWIPESPYYYFWKDDKENGLKTLHKLRSTPNLAIEVEVIMENIKIEKKFKLMDCLKDSVNQKALALLLGAFACQQFCGIMAVIAYTAEIFAAIGGSVSSAQTNNIIFGCLGLVSIFTSGQFVDKLGRRLLLLISSLATALAFCILATYLVLKDYYEIQNYSILATVSLLAFPVTYGMGLGPIPFIYSGELLPPNFKIFSSAVASGVAFFCGFLVSYTYPILTKNFGLSSVMYGYAFLCVLGAVFTAVYLPETKGLTLEQIQNNLRSQEKPQKKKHFLKFLFSNSHKIDENFSKS